MPHEWVPCPACKKEKKAYSSKEYVQDIKASTSLFPMEINYMRNKNRSEERQARQTAWDMLWVQLPMASPQG